MSNYGRDTKEGREKLQFCPQRLFWYVDMGTLIDKESVREEWSESYVYSSVG